MRAMRFKLSSIILAVAASVAMAFPVTAYASDYIDVPANHWAEKSGVIDGITELGIIKGVEKDNGLTYFMPDEKVTRAQIAVMLSRYAGADVAGEYPVNETSWTDVADGKWYTAAMNWAEAEGVLNGSDGKVRPNDNITRQELVTVLCRMAAKEGADTASDTDRLTKYPDDSKISGWAKSSVSWAVEKGLMGGSANLNPKGNATRAEASKMILVFAQGGVEADPLFKSHFIDVGQGDAIFLELPNGETMLIDAGAKPYGDDVARFIETRGYSAIDYVVMSHPDADHIGGMAEVITSFEIGTILAPECGDTTQTWISLMETIALKDEEIVPIWAEDVIVDTGDFKIECLWPYSICSDNNENSAALLVTYGDFEWLYTGDISADNLDRCDVAFIDVLKVPHHGADSGMNTSVAFDLYADYAVVSVGENDYGHPSRNVMFMLEHPNVMSEGTIFSTHKSGTVSGYCDLEKIWFDATPWDYNTDPEFGFEGGIGSGMVGGPLPGLVPDDKDGESSSGGRVCITRTGSKYHYDWCPTLSRSKNLTYLSKAAARERGYSACKVCM